MKILFPVLFLFVLSALSACEVDMDESTSDGQDTAESGASADDWIIALGDALTAPESHGPYDLAWRVTLDLEPLKATASGDVLENFLVLPEFGKIGLTVSDTEGDRRHVVRGEVFSDQHRGGSATLSMRGERLDAQFRFERRRYQIREVSGEGHVLFRLDEERMPDPHPSGGPVIPDEPDSEPDSEPNYSQGY